MPAGDDPARPGQAPVYVRLVVDLDGTLVRTDLLIETTLLLLRTNPLYGFAILAWFVTGGRARLAREVAARIEIDAARLPYDVEFLEFLFSEHDRGRRLILATASDPTLAEAVAPSRHFCRRGLRIRGRGHA